VRTLVVVSNPRDWPLALPGVEVVQARAYLADPVYSGIRRAAVFNLCRSYGYQTLGYYVSLLAAARGHRPLPSINTLQDLKSPSMVRILSGDLMDLVRKSLAPIHSDSFTFSIYFGRNLAKRHQQLALRFFNAFQAPLLRLEFVRDKVGWSLRSVRAIPASEVPEEHRDFVMQVAADYFAGRRPRRTPRNEARYDLAILHDPHERDAPSDNKALQRFIRAAERLGIASELITRDDYGRVAEFDALFIRATTNVNHYTFRFAQRAQAQGLVVMDDPDSILKCSNKVYLAELMERHGVLTPRTLVVHRGNSDTVEAVLGLPCVLKQPDSSFSLGVVKVATTADLAVAVERLLQRSELIVAQEFLPTDFDWRVGVIDGRALYVCRYHMAKSHWQIIKRDASGRKRSEGEADTLAVDAAPRAVISTALKAARLIGDGLYGVDLKQVGGKVYVIEVNDNPNIDAGIEDEVLNDSLYREVIYTFLQRIEHRGRTRA
jgi:glutathione synthase/RimK-type ligase-like ATP-grasp enzyme